MRSQNAGRGGLLHAGYPHQGTVNDGIAVREGLFPSRSDCIQTLPDCNSGCPRAADLTYQITIVIVRCAARARRGQREATEGR